MADELMTTADMADGKLDLTTLKVYINGDENVVNEPRLAPSVNVGSLAALNKHVKDKVDLQIATIPSGRKGYATLALAQAAQSTLAANTLVEVTNDTTTANNGVYLWDGTTLLKSNSDVLGQAKTYADTQTDVLKNTIFTKTGKNLLDKTKIVAGEYVSPSKSKVSTSASYRRSDFIRIVAGTTYTVSGVDIINPVVGWYATNDKTSTAINVTQTATATAPTGANYAIVNITNDGTTNYDGTAQFEVGNIKTAYEPYKQVIDLANVENGNNFIARDTLLTSDSFNKIDPSKANYVKRYSTALNFVSDTLGIAASDYIPVKEGEWYTVSGEYFSNAGGPQGGYFTSYGAITALQNIEWVKPVNNVGHAFKVPTGLGITHVVINLNKLNKQASSTTLNGNVQLELGEMPTAYQAYNLKTYIKPELLPNQTATTPTSNGTFDNKAWYEYTQTDGAKIYQDKLPKFRKAMLLKDKDVCVVMTGTSLTARTSEHSTLRTDASIRPPMMHSNAFCSYIWDALRWAGQQYRRYDVSGFFVETGTFATSSNLSEWDDGAYRDGLTRYSSDATASVKFTIPIDAWQFNFIYRTDSVGCTAKVVVAEGNGQLQVFDEATSTWVEANNYTFSQLEATPITRTVAIPNVITEVTTNYTLASKGNTTYQKRLKMRCRSSDGAFDSRASAKNVTISRVGDGARFMYWGVEWSNRQFMITYINSSRGSHNTNATGTSGLPRYQDNEVWGFKPDLILSELAIHNDGAAAAGIYPVGQWRQLAKHYVTNTAYELSLYSRAAYFNQSPEYAFFMGSITWNFGGINDDGSLKFGLQTSSTFGGAKAMTALDKYQEAVQYLKEQDIPVIDTAQRWVDAGKAIFGDLKSATVGSGKAGQTFTNEGSHWNDTGAKIVAKAVLPLIK